MPHELLVRMANSQIDFGYVKTSALYVLAMTMRRRDTRNNGAADNGEQHRKIQ